MSSPARRDAIDEHTLAVIELTAQRVVEKHSANCPIAAEFRRMHADVYGPEGEKDEHPGLMGDMADLKHSRRNLWLALRGAWALLLVFAGWAVKQLLGS